MATITEDYVSFETAKLLKEKGFNDELCHMWYNIRKDVGYYLSSVGVKNHLPAPTHQMAMKWLRKTHNINTDIVPIWNQNRFEYQVFIVTPENAKHCYIDDKLYLVYEEAVEAALKYSLKNLI